MKSCILKSIVAFIVITISPILFILNSNIIYAQSDTVEFNKSSGKKGSIVVRTLVDVTLTSTAQLYDPAINKMLMSVNINQSGDFFFEGIAPGEYVINISYPGYMDHPVAVSIREGMNVIEEQFLTYYYLGSGSIGLPVNAPAEILQPSVEYSKRKTILGEYPEISGYRIFTVCELLGIESFQWIHGLPVVIIGNLVQTPEGSWLKQSCGNHLQSGAHTWPDAIFLNKNSSDSKRMTFILEDADKRFGKDFTQNNSNGDSVAVAVAGRLVAGDSLVYVKCGEEKTCGFGYGPIVAPIQINYELMRYLTHQNTNTE